MAEMDLGKQVGPLPLGGWIAVIAIGLGIAYLNRRGTGGSTPGPEYVESGDGTPGVGMGGSGMVWQNVAPPQMGGSVAPEPVDNEGWGRKATNYLIAQGYDPAVSDSAVRKYLSTGEALSAQEYTLIKLVLGALGATPIPLPPPLLPPPTVIPTPPPVTTPPPTEQPKPVPKPTPATFRYHTVIKGENLYRIALKYYPVSNWGWIYNANRVGIVRKDGTPGFLISPDLIYPGQKLLIP